MNKIESLLFFYKDAFLIAKADISLNKETKPFDIVWSCAVRLLSSTSPNLTLGINFQFKKDERVTQC